MVDRRRLNWVCSLIASALAISANAQTVVDSTLTVTAVLPPFSLAIPTQIRFLSLNDFLVTEKDTGRVRRVQSGSLLPTEVLDLPVAIDNERGLLGLTLDPEFFSNHFVYIYYSATTGGDGGPWLENRLSRFVWNGTSLVGEVILKTFGSASDGQAASDFHMAGPILFGPDQRLYGTTGDLGRFLAEQNNTAEPNSSALVGGVYRLNSNGSVPASNPFASSPNPDFRPWYAYGIRNSYGIAFDKLTGRLWQTENGPDVYDEINLVAAGFNGGWTQIIGPANRDPEGTGNLVQLPGSAYSDPEFSFFNPVAVTGLAFLADSSFGPSYQDALLVGDFNNGQLYLFRLNANRDGFVLSGGLADRVADDVNERNQVRFGENFGSITDIQIGPDGAAYVISIGNGTVYRILPEPRRLVTMPAGALGVGWLGYARRRRPVRAALRADALRRAAPLVRTAFAAARRRALRPRLRAALFA